jgi:hypothetical protein
MNSETVKPIPATAAMPTTPAQVAPLGRWPIPRRDATQENSVMPTGLPTTKPRTTPAVTGEPAASRRAPELRGTPALASAKTGTIRKLAHGCSTCSSHSATDTDSRARRAVRRAARGVATSASSAGSGRAVGVAAGASRPMATPARVAWTPASCRASHSPAPSAT